jgi:hypothetical protein
MNITIAIHITVTRRSGADELPPAHLPPPQKSPTLEVVLFSLIQQHDLAFSAQTKLQNQQGVLVGF